MVIQSLITYNKLLEEKVNSELEKLQNGNRMNKHSRFQRDTHFEFEQEIDFAYTNF